MLLDRPGMKALEAQDQLIFDRFLQIEERLYFVLARLRKLKKLLGFVQTNSCTKYN